MGKVTALVSAYYADRFMDTRLTNLFGQKKQVDLEIIVICQSGSPEERIASNYNVKVVRTVDIPPLGEAWNLGIEHATGDYLTTANTDDKFNLGGLAKMADVLDQHQQIGLVFSQVDQDNGKEIFPWRRLDRPTGEVIKPYDLLKSRCVIGPMPLWRRSIHWMLPIGHRYFDEAKLVAADYQMWLTMAKAGVRFYYIAESCGTYLNRDDSLEHKHKELCRMETKQIREAA